MKEIWNFVDASALLVIIAFIYFSTFVYLTNRKNKKQREIEQKREEECLDRIKEQELYYSQFSILLLFDRQLHMVNKQSGLDLLKLNNCEFYQKNIVPGSTLFSKGMIVEFDHAEIPDNDPTDNTPLVFFRPKNGVAIDDAVVKTIFYDEMIVESKSLGRIMLDNKKKLHAGAQVRLFQHVKKTPQGYLVFYDQWRKV